MRLVSKYSITFQSFQYIECVREEEPGADFENARSRIAGAGGMSWASD